MAPTPLIETAVIDNTESSIAPPAVVKFIDLRNLDLAPAQGQFSSIAAGPAGVDNPAFVLELDNTREEISADLEHQQRESQLTQETWVGLSLSVGAILLSGVMRAGYLLAGLLSVLPLWKSFDPLPILNAYKKHNDAPEPDEDQVEELFDQPAHRQEPPRKDDA